MDSPLYCNTLHCRVQLTESAVVTSCRYCFSSRHTPYLPADFCFCSHIFCLACSESSGLSEQANGHRICPACNIDLPNQDDVWCTHLNPTDDYKATLMSGLHPTTIMECAGRGIAFWAYQCTQEMYAKDNINSG